MNALAKQVKAGTGGFITGPAAIDGIATAIRARQVDAGHRPRGAAGEVPQGPDPVGARELHAAAAFGVRPAVPRDPDPGQQGAGGRHGHGQGRPEDLGHLAVVETQTEATRRPGDTLRAAAVSRSFQGVQALTGVDLEVHRPRGRRPDRTERRRQVDARQPAHRLRPGRRGHGRAQRPGRDPLEPRPPRTRRAHAHLPAQPRLPRALRA